MILENRIASALPISSADLKWHPKPWHISMRVASAFARSPAAIGFAPARQTNTTTAA
jgi:hypothetical protein